MGIDLLDIRMNVEREFGIQIPPEELVQIQTVDDFGTLVRTVIERAGPGSTSVPTDEEILLRLRPIICRCLYVEPEQVVPEARLVEDLGCE